MRYAQASPVMRTMQAAMRAWSRRRRAAAGSELSTPPGKRRVLPVVFAGRVVPPQAERVHVALRRMGEGESIRCRMARVVEVQRFRGIGIDALGALSRHVNQACRLHGPIGSIAIKPNRRRFHTQKLSNETG